MSAAAAVRTSSSFIEALLSVTPYPPLTDDVDELLAAADRMVFERDAVLAMASPGYADAALVAELEARQMAWTVALQNARERLGGQRINNKHVRAYAR